MSKIQYRGAANYIIVILTTILLVQPLHYRILTARKHFVGRIKFHDTY